MSERAVTFLHAYATLDGEVSERDQSGSASEREDVLLLRQALDGDRRAAAALVKRHQAVLLGWITQSVGNRETAKEILQDVFGTVFARGREFRGDASFKTWLFQIARRRCIDHSRRMRFRNHASLSSEPEPRAEAPQERAAEARRKMSRVRAALEALPVEQQEVFLLRHVSGLKIRQIAEVTGVNVNTVKSRLRYALESVQREMGEDQ